MEFRGRIPHREEWDPDYYQNGGVRTGLTPSPHARNRVLLTYQGASLNTTETAVAEWSAISFDYSMQADTLIQSCGQDGHTTPCWNQQRTQLWNEYLAAAMRRVQHISELGGRANSPPIGVDESYLAPSAFFNCYCSGVPIMYGMKIEVREGGLNGTWWEFAAPHNWAPANAP